MGISIAQHLQNCALADSSLEPLAAQWQFDRRLTAKALQNVSQLFPHYSRHDESHSQQIISNIERVLGDKRIIQLTASDAWLILESAFHHDIGMVVSSHQRHVDWTSNDFKDFLTRQIENANGDDQAVINAMLNSTSLDLPEVSGLHPLTVVSKITQVSAEFYRKQHPARASEIVESPVSTINLNSPRTELIPKRLFSILGDICRLHGAGREELLNIPKAATGLGRDMIHPRFIASMLRIGDLLDLDDNRFCPVMLGIAGDLPASTHAHIEKHHSIRHFRIDSERIEVSADCNTYQGYVEAENWFDYLRSEVAWQMAHWADIAPSIDFGLLPTIGQIETKLSGYELIDNRTRPQFQVDHLKAMELLQGAGVYRSPRDALRELIQNAIDATLLHVWLRHGATEAGRDSDSMMISDSDNPSNKSVIDVLDKYPLHIKVEPLSSNAKKVLITIRDLGTGISRSDLQSMCTVGGSYKNSWKQGVIRRMPVWMRPSGVFGIGLQSIFLLTDEVTFESFSLIDGRRMSVRMSNPIGKERGAVYIKAESEVLRYSPGTEVKIAVDREALRWSDRAFSFREPKNDPLREVDFLGEILQNVPLPVILNGVIRSRPLQVYSWEYDPGMEMLISIDRHRRPDRDGVLLFFKGQPLRGGLYEGRIFPFSIAVNLYGDASTQLSISRDYIKSDSARQRIRNGIASQLKKLLSTAPENERPLFSINLLMLDQAQDEHYLKCRWVPRGLTERMFAMSDDARFPCVGEVIDADLTVVSGLGEYPSRHIAYGEGLFSDSEGGIEVFVKAALHNGRRGFLKNVSKTQASIVYLKGVVDDTPEIVKLIEAQIEENLRLCLPVPIGFEILACLELTYEVRRLSYGLDIGGRQFFYSPFIMIEGGVTVDLLDKLIGFTYEKRFDRVATKDQIRNKYSEFIAICDRQLNKVPRWKNLKKYEVPAL